jgi:CRP/FNR family transcriptional regulator, cyclic AMP receptor protein
MLSAERGIKKKFFRAGDAVFSEGDPGDMAYLVETGSIGISKVIEGEEVDLATMVEGELFGEMAILDGSPRMANAHALVDTVVITLPSDIFESKLESTEPFFKTLIQILVDNLRNVHRVYMHRPRSVTDYLSAVSFHNDGLASYVGKMDDRELKANALPHLVAVTEALGALREIFHDHNDRRDSALHAADITRRKPEA